MNHTMEQTPRRLTKAGLIIEFISGVLILLTYLGYDKLTDPDFLLKLDPSTTQSELDLIAQFSNFFEVTLIVSFVITLIMFIINYILFSGLYKGKYKKEKAMKIYNYQFILGIVYLFFNTVVGILYLISGNQGKNEQLDKPEVREGI